MPAKPPNQPGGARKAAGPSQNGPSGGSSGKTSAKKPSSEKPSSARSCPICGKPAAEASKPFCSERCRDVDLNRWLSGSYVIPAKPDDGDDGE